MTVPYPGVAGAMAPARTPTPQPRVLHWIVLAAAIASLLTAALIGIYVFQPVRQYDLGSSQASVGMTYPGLFLLAAAGAAGLCALAMWARHRLAALLFALTAGLGLAYAGHASWEMWSVARREGVPVSLAEHFTPPLGRPAAGQIPARVARDVVFGQAADGTALKLDVWPATTPAGGTLRPAIVRLHSGGWIGGAKGERPAWSEWLNAQGFVVFDVDYRLAPKAGWREQAGDVKCALAFVAANAGAYGVDPSLISLMGLSAGGNLALLAAYSPAATLPASCPGEVPPVKTVINVYGPSDLTALWRTSPTPAVMDDALGKYLGGAPGARPDDYRLASPVTHVTPAAPPTISFYGASDRLVGIDQEMALETALIAANARHETYILPGAEHGYDAHWDGLASQYTRVRLKSFLDRYGQASLSR